MFLFDPTQEPDFRRMCRGKTNDPQMRKSIRNHRQVEVLSEAAKRIRDQTGLRGKAMDSKPLIVIVTKYDAWCSLMGGFPLRRQAILPPGHATQRFFDEQTLQSVSNQVRQVLLEYSRELVMEAESFSEDVIYIPVSATGHSPKLIRDDEGKGHLRVNTSSINPMWCEMPLLYALFRSVDGLLRTTKKQNR